MAISAKNITATLYCSQTWLPFVIHIIIIIIINGTISIINITMNIIDLKRNFQIN